MVKFRKKNVKKIFSETISWIKLILYFYIPLHKVFFFFCFCQVKTMAARATFFFILVIPGQ